MRNDIRARLVTITKEEAKASAKVAIAREAQIAQVAGSPTTVAVLPFTIGGGDAKLQPLQVGLADLVISDLAKTKKLTVVERDKVQAIADELALAKSGQVDAATAVRAGKLIQAGRIVKGSLISTGPATAGSSSITMTSTVVNTQDAATRRRGQQPEQHPRPAVQPREKALGAATFVDLGITLTPAEQQDVDRRPTQSLQAFLAYSRGLMAEDAGRLDEAARFFENARSIDPGFGAALQRAQSAAQSQQSTAKIEAHLSGSDEGRTVKSDLGGNRSPGSQTNTLNTVVGDVNPTTTNSGRVDNTTSPRRRPHGPAFAGHRHRPARAADRGSDHHHQEAVKETRRCAPDFSRSPFSWPPRFRSRRRILRAPPIILDPQYVSYQLGTGATARTISQLGVPFAVIVPFSDRFNIDISSSYANSQVKVPGTATSTITGFTDTQVRGNLTLGDNAAVLTLGVNLPSGQYKVPDGQQAAAGQIGNDFLIYPVTSMGNGLAATGGVGFAQSLGTWNLGIGASFRYSTAFDAYQVQTSVLRFTARRTRPGCASDSTVPWVTAASTSA